MSEQNRSDPKTIASGSKVKDPKRVAAGKRLGAISKQAKEAKRLERESQQTAQSEETEVDNKYTHISSADYSRWERHPTYYS